MLVKFINCPARIVRLFSGSDQARTCLVQAVQRYRNRRPLQDQETRTPRPWRILLQGLQAAVTPPAFLSSPC